MPDNLSIKLQGVDELREVFNGLTPKVAARASRTGLRRGAQDLRRTLRGRVPIGDTKQLQKSIRYRARRLKRGSATVGYKVYVRGLHELERANKNSYIWNAGLMRMFEYGGSEHANFPRRPFWNQIVNSKTSELLEIIIGSLGDAVDIEAGKDFARQRRRANRPVRGI